MDVIADFEAVIREVREARPVPFSASAIVDRKALLERLEALLEAVPGELKKARWIIEDREEVLARIQREAQETLERARRERDRMLSRSEVDRAASVEAERVIDSAKAQAREIRLDAEHFVDGKLASLEVGLQKMLALVQSASSSLADVSGPPPRLSAAPKRAVTARPIPDLDDDEEASMRPADPLEVPRTEARPVQPTVVVEHAPVVDPRPAPVADTPSSAMSPPAVQHRPAPASDPPPAAERTPAVQRRPAPKDQLSAAERPSAVQRRPAPVTDQPAAAVRPAAVQRPPAPIAERRSSPRAQAPAARDRAGIAEGRDRNKARRSQAPRASEPGAAASAPRPGVEPVAPRVGARRPQEPPGGSAGRTLGLGLPPTSGSGSARPSATRQGIPRQADPGGMPTEAEAQAPPSPSSPPPVVDSRRDAPSPRSRSRGYEEVAAPPPAPPSEPTGDRSGERVAGSERTGTVRVIRIRGDRSDLDPPRSPDSLP